MKASSAPYGIDRASFEELLQVLEELLAETAELSYSKSDVSEEVKEKASAAIAKAKGR